LHIVTQQGEPRNSPIMKHFQVEELGPLRRVCKAWNAITPVPDNEKADFLWNNLKKEKESLIRNISMLQDECTKNRNSIQRTIQEHTTERLIWRDTRYNLTQDYKTLENKNTDLQINHEIDTFKKEKEIHLLREEKDSIIQRLSKKNTSLQQKNLTIIALSTSLITVWALDSLLFRSKIHPRLQTFNKLILTKVFHLQPKDPKYKLYNNIMTTGNRILLNVIEGSVTYIGLKYILQRIFIK
jgi:hypothetical protein